MLGFLIRAKHCECSDILQIFVPHYLEEPCRVMVRRRTTGAATLCCSGHFTSDPKLECVIEQNKETLYLLTGTIYRESILVTSSCHSSIPPYSCHDYHRPPHHRPSTILQSLLWKEFWQILFPLSSKVFLIFWHCLESKLWKTPWLRALGGGERFYSKS